jgi:type I restriction enzyme M protein
MANLTLETLETWLWDSADILRGSIDSSDYKNYIFGILFLKRTNDVFEEEVENIMKKEGISREDAEEETYFKVPPEARWKEITKKTENIGEKLDQAFAAIERDNQELENVLTATKYGDKEVLADETLQSLLRHFNKYSLRNENLYKPDILGDAYEYLIKMFADAAGKKGGEFYTPKGVVKLIVQLIKPQPGNTVYDPTVGSGGMLIESARYVAKQPEGKQGNHINISLYGQEKNLGTWAICKINMLLHNYTDASIHKGDTLTNPKHKNGDSDLMHFNRVIANPPFSQNKWWAPAENSVEKKVDKNGNEKEIAPKYNKEVVDKFGRFHFGIPPRGYADLAFLQHMVAVLKQNGRLGVVLPHGTLFRGNTEGKIRKKIIQSDLIEGIVGLPSALFYNTGIPASIWIINKDKPAHLKSTIKIVDGSQQYKEGRNQNELLNEHIEQIVQAYDEEQDVDKFMRMVEMEEIEENDYNLNISRYIDTTEPEPEVDLVAVRKEINKLEDKENEIDERLNQYLEELGL